MFRLTERNDEIIFGHFKNISVYDQTMTEKNSFGGFAMSIVYI